MAQDEMLSALKRISKPLTFPKDTVIIREGTTGLQMYIVIQGKVGIYINTLLDERIKVAESESGSFFGEMSMFDNLPRSATCIALEDTVCIAISRNNLQEFIASCPQLAEKMMLSLSTRLRAMNDQIYKSPELVASSHFDVFAIPPLHRPHSISAPPANSRSLAPFQDHCPVCKKEITLSHLQTYTLSLKRMDNNMRRIYKELDVLWHYLWSCSECGYTNFSTNFQQVQNMNHRVLEYLVEEQARYRRKNLQSSSDFDVLAYHYYQAIHLNACLNKNDHLLQGKLWLYLHWLYSDAKDEDMAGYTLDQALDQYLLAYDNGPRQLKTDDSQMQCAQILAELYFEKGDDDSAFHYYQEVLKFNSPFWSRKAHDRIYEIRELRRIKREKADT